MKCSIFWNKQEPGRLITKHLFKRKSIAKQHRVMWCNGSAILNWRAVLSRETASFHSCSIVALYCGPSSTGFTIFVQHLHNSDSVVWSRVFVYLGFTYYVFPQSIFVLIDLQSYESVKPIDACINHEKYTGDQLYLPALLNL